MKPEHYAKARGVLKDLAPPILWRVLSSWTSRSRTRSAQQSVSIFEIPLSQCVTFGGFHYGRQEYNPIESYLIDLVNGASLAAARQRSIEFFRYYRPRHMAEALGMLQLAQEAPLWLFPWQRAHPSSPYYERGWRATPIECQDVITLFCTSGILAFLIDHEFYLSERALYSIAESGYQAEQHACYVQTTELRRSDGTSVYLLQDGNHRTGAMSALGYRTITVQQAAKDVVLEQDCDDWYGVKTGIWSRADALQIFDAYFEGNHNYRTTTKPAQIITHEHCYKSVGTSTAKGSSVHAPVGERLADRAMDTSDVVHTTRQATAV